MILVYSERLEIGRGVRAHAPRTAINVERGVPVHGKLVRVGLDVIERNECVRTLDLTLIMECVR